MDRGTKIEKQIRNRMGYQRFLRWLRLMRQGKYFKVLLEMHAELDHSRVYKYRTTFLYATENLLTIAEDYEKLGDDVFKNNLRIIPEKEAKFTETGVSRYKRGSIPAPHSERYYRDMLLKVARWSQERRANYQARFRRRGEIHGNENELAWIERNMADKPPYSGD